MAVQIPKPQLPKLQAWLRSYLWKTFKISKQLDTHLRHGIPGLQFYADRWPNPQAVVAVTDATSTKIFEKDFEGVFGLTEDAVIALLRDAGLVDWGRNVMIHGLPDDLYPAVKRLAEEMNMQYSCDSVLGMRATECDLQYLPVLQGMKIGPIPEESVKALQSNWPYLNEKGDDCRLYFRGQIRHPSVMLTTDSTDRVGYMMGMDFGVLGTLFVEPQFRSKGYAKVIISQLAQMYFDKGEDVFVLIIDNNTASIRLHLSCGFKNVSDMGLTFVYCKRN